MKKLLSTTSNTTTARRLVVILLVLGFGLRLGYGVIRYRSELTSLSGAAFINRWDHDALYHVLIAKALLSGKGYVVDDSPLPAQKRIRYAGEDALFKAPLYEFFLAGVFAISGYSFRLFFPLQALLGGLLTGLTGLITLQIFGKPRAAWFAGFAAAVQPVLVNSASQPYNEDFFFFLFVASIWAFLVWFETQRIKWAFLCGAMIGLCTLTRENGVLLLIAMGAVGLIAARRTLRSCTGYVVITLISVAVVAPWTIRNYLRFGAFVPVATITGVDLAAGNNECVASEGILVPYWAEGPCASLDERRRAQPIDQASLSRVPAALRADRISRRIATQFILAHPGAYAKLVFRRLWTTLLPFDPRGDQRLHERIVLLLYWVMLFPAGITGMVFGLKRIEPRRALLGLLIVLNLLSIMAVLYWSDLRFRIGIDLLLGCFAGWAYDEFLWRGARKCSLAELPSRLRP